MHQNRVKIISYRHLFVKDERGATAVEFALIGPPFFALIGFMLLGGHMLWLSHSMDTSIQLVSRQIRTGQAQAAGMTISQFRNAICSHVTISQDQCRSKLIVDVKQFDGPEDIDFSPPEKNGGVDQEAGVFQMGEREDYVIAKIYLPIEYLTKLARLVDGNTDLDVHLSSTAAFRNEPF